MPSRTSLIQANAGFEWQLAIADPTVMGWLIVALYGVAEYYCVLNYRRREKLIDQPRKRRLGVYWFALSLGMLFMGFNRQLDLQSLIHEVTEELARDDGWLALSRGLKLALLAGIMLSVVIALAWFIRLMKTLGDKVLISALGFSVLVAFVVMQAAGFYVEQMDLAEPMTPVGPAGRVFELTGIALIIGGARRSLRLTKSDDFVASQHAD